MIAEVPSFSYVVSHPSSLGVGFDQPIMLLLVPLALLLFAVGKKKFPRATILRVTAFLALVLALAGFHFTTSLPSSRLSLVAVVDVSESTDAAAIEWSHRYLNEAVRGLAPGDELSVLTFAKDVRIVRPPGPPAAVDDLPAPKVLSATDLSQAITTGTALFPSEGEHRLLLLTDGNETRDDSRRLVARLQDAEVRVDVAIPPSRSEPDLRVEKLIVAPVVVEGRVVPLRVVATNSGKLRPAVLSLYVDGKIMDSAAVELQPGLNTLDLPSQLIGQGSHRLRAVLEGTDDSTPGNNYREVGITIRGRTRILLVTPRGRSPIELILEQRDFDVDLRTPEQFPATLDELAAYNGVVLEDINAAGFDPMRISELERFVRELGGGLIFAGGTATFGDVDLTETALKQLLPVTLEPRRPRPGQREPLALFIVIDRSNSMGYNSRIGTLRDGEKLRYAKEAAVAVVRQLRDQDLVGVIAFDSQPREIAALGPLHVNRARLEELIPKLVENGGTDFYDALASAREQLSASRVSRRHVILLTDGDTNRSAVDEYRSLIREIAADKISVTTIRIGDNTVNLGLLKEISEYTGGQFHYVENVRALPELMLRDATRALGSLSRSEERFFPETGARSQFLLGIHEQDIPPVADYAFAKPKTDAEVALRVNRLERSDPLLAVWQYGLGRVAAFTASPSTDAEQWLGWSELGKFWSQLARWTARAHTENDVAIDVQRRDGIVQLEVQTFGRASDGGVPVARLEIDEETIRSIDLAPQGPRRFRAELPNLPSGQYPLTVVTREAGGTVQQRTQLVTIPDADTESQEEHRRDGPNFSLLTTLTEETGGRLNPKARDLVERIPGTRRAAYPIDHVLVPLAMLLFLADIAVRRLGRG
jgi:Mg-chelatase subunit ChlD